MNSSGSKPSKPAAPIQGDRFGKFIRTQKLGAGAGGEVFKAWDSELNRWAALKFLKGGDAEELGRFRREAQIAAKLTHPNIAAVYEVGELDGAHFIAMQFVDGTTLRPWISQRVPAERAACAIRDAARAVAFAHERDVVHRDLKPENLMVSGDHLFVMDFGLARAIEAGSNLSVSGSVVGTPAYMAPEQARGDRVDARADVYSLGATLYELLSRRKPIGGVNLLDLIARVQTEEPAAIAGIDADLHAVIMKCLEKSPTGRYESATALADDLDRWLSGEAVSARAIGSLRRAMRAAGRRKGVLTVVAIGILAIGAITTTLVLRLGRQQSAVEGAKHDVVEQLRKTAASWLDSALSLRRAGTISGMEKFADELDVACRRVITEKPALAEPHYLLGRMHRARMRWDDAMREQEAALKLQPDHGGARYERGLLRIRLSDLRVIDLLQTHRARQAASIAGEAGRIGSYADELQAATAGDEELSRLRNGAAGDFMAARGACSDAFVAYLAGDDRTAGLFEAAVRDTPDAEEAYERIAEISKPVKAIEWLSKGIDHDRGYAPFWSMRAERHFQQAAAQMQNRGTAAIPWFEKAEADDRACLALAPDDARAQYHLGDVLIHAATYDFYSGRDPAPLQNRAIVELEKAAALDPTSFRPLLRIASAKALMLAISDTTSRATPPEIAEVEEAFARALRLAPRESDIHAGRAMVHANLGWRAQSRGESPEEHYRKAEEFMGEAINLSPRSNVWWQQRAVLRLQWISSRLDRKADWSTLLDSAETDANEALRLSPRTPETLRVHAWMLQFKAVEIKDPRVREQALRKVLVELDEALWTAPRFAEAYRMRGGAHVHLAQALDHQGGDPEQAFTMAISDFTISLEIIPGDAETLNKRGGCHYYFGLWLIRNRREAKPELRACIDDHSAALALDASDIKALCDRGAARVKLGLMMMLAKEDADLVFRGGIDDYASALRLRRGDARALLGLAEAQVYYGQFLIRIGKDPTQPLKEATRIYLGVVKNAPSQHEGWKMLGTACFCQGRWAAQRDENAAAYYQSALDAWGQAEKITPGCTDNVKTSVQEAQDYMKKGGK